MKIFSAKLFSILVLLACLAIPDMAPAHNLWLNATDYCPELRSRAGAHTKVYLGFGHKFPVHDFLSRASLEEFKLIQPGNKSRDLEPGQGGFLATPLILKKEGSYTVTAATAHGFYTMYRDGDRIHHKLGSKEGLENVILSLYYENYAKALINVGDCAPEAFSTPVGHGIEIVPLENPFLKKAGDSLKLKVLHNGRPASFCPVSATYVGFSSGDDYAYANKTNGRGVTTIRLMHPGQWIVLATVRKPADETIKAKCIEMKYTASISFEVR